MKTIRMLSCGFLKLKHPVAIAWFLIAMPITIAVCLLEIVGLALCAPSAWWKNVMRFEIIGKETPV